MGIKLETNNRNISRKAFNIWKRNNTLKKSISKKKKKQWGKYNVFQDK